MLMAQRWLIVFGVWLMGFSNVFAQTAHRGSIEPGSVLIQLDKSVSPDKLVAQFQELDGFPTALRVEKPLAPAFSIWEFSFDTAFPNPRKLLEKLSLHPLVRSAQFNHRLHFRELLPDDPSFSNQWYLHNTGLGNQLADADIDAEIAWDHSTGGITLNGDTIVIAQIDDGTALAHPDLMENTWKNHEEIPDNGIDDDLNGYIDDHFGWNVSAGMDLVQFGVHGVRVAGVMGATPNNGVGVSGLGWHSKIMHIVGITNLESEAIEGFYYVWNARKRYNESQGSEGAFVVAINASWGVNGGQPADFPLWCGMIDSLGQQGVLTVAATANENWNVDQVGDIPTACPSDYLISVTASNAQDQRTFAAYGPEHIDLAAPGDSIYTTSGSNGYDWATGTSFAAPLVSGSLALLYGVECSHLQSLLQQSPAAAASWVRSVLLATVDPIPSLAEDVKSGGRLNIGNATQLVDQLCHACPDWTYLNVAEYSDESIHLNWTFLQSPDALKLYWRTVDAPNWVELNLADTVQSFTFSDLPSCEGIECFLQWECGSDQYQSDIQSFTSLGCCSPPEEVYTTTLGADGLFCSWAPQTGAQGYLVHLRPVGTISWTTYPTPVPYLEVHELISCFPYELQVVPVCAGLQTPVAPIQIVQTGGCSSCTQFDYCSAAANATNYEWIEAVKIDNFTHYSGANGGYANFTGVPVPLALNNPHILSLTPGALQPDYPANWKVWIDLNQDGFFTEPQELIYHSEVAKMGTVIHPFLLPANTQTGVTRMRIAMTWEDGPTLQACGDFDFGEVEDYCVYISAEDPLIDCPSAPQMTMLEQTQERLSFSWDPAPHDFGYQVRWRKTGTTAWETTTVFMHQVSLEQLDPCTDYEISVQRICLAGLSGYSTPGFFSTACASASGSPLLSSFSVFPNPFVDKIFVSSTGSTQEARVRIYAHNGQFLKESNLKTDGWLEVPDLPAGLYLLQIQIPGATESWIKLVKE
jgi:serine protease